MTAPAPRRQRRISDIEPWRMYLSVGYDYLDALEAVGLSEATVTMREAEAAWRLHGRQIMADFEPSGWRQQPWGLEQFGPPT